MAENKEEQRTLKISIVRYNPELKGDKPRIQTFELNEEPGMTLFIALNDLRKEQDNSLKFDFVCRAGICGSCAMIINGKPGLACKTLTKNMDTEILLAPLPIFQLIGDLSVFTGKWMRDMNNRFENWIHDDEIENNLDASRIEEPMDPDLAEEIYEVDRCVECGCCIAACGTALMRPKFAGAVALNKVARFMIDPRDKRKDEEYYELIGDEEGIFGCMSLVGCDDVCPKKIPLQRTLAYTRKKMVKFR